MAQRKSNSRAAPRSRPDPKGTPAPRLVNKTTKRQRKKLAEAEDAFYADGIANAAAEIDPATKYAADVVAGRVIAGRWIILACRRHLRDIYRSDLVWDTAEGDRFELFCRDFAVIRNPVSQAREPFVLLPWQRFIARSIFCWKIAPKVDDFMGRLPGTRRFREVLLEAAKGNGKTPFFSAVQLYLLMVEDENEFEGYVGAANMEQAMIPMDDMKDFLDHMVDTNKIKKVYFAQEMSGRGRNKIMEYPCVVLNVKNEHTRKITYVTTKGIEKGFIEAVTISGSGTGLAGLRPALVTFEEVHEITNPALIPSLSMGVKARTQPLILKVTNTGKGRENQYWADRTRGLNMLEGKHDDDTLLVAIYTVDEDDQPWTDERCWHKANPSLQYGSVIRLDFIRQQVVRAQDPQSRANVDRLCFGIWVDAMTVLFDQQDWDRVQKRKFRASAEMKHVAAIDLAVVQDMIAITDLYIKKAGGAFPVYLCRTKYWWNEYGLSKKSEQLQAWFRERIKEGWIHMAPGNENDMKAVARHIKARSETLTGLAFDPYRFIELKAYLRNASVRFHDALKDEPKSGIALYRHPQGTAQVGGASSSPLWMSRSIKHFIACVTDEMRDRIVIEENPILTLNMGANQVDQDRIGNPFFNRPTASPTSKPIDGAISLTMAVGLANYITQELGGSGKGIGEGTADYYAKKQRERRAQSL